MQHVSAKGDHARSAHGPARGEAADGVAGSIAITLLGPVQCSVAGKPADIGGPKSRLLLARLVLAAPHVVSVDDLVDSVWGDSPPATVHKSIQKYVSGLRRTLGPEVVVTEGGGYAVAIDTSHVDVLRFERLVDEARAARAGGRLRQAWELYEEALGLWQGSPLAGLADVPFVAAEIRRLEDLRLGALEEQMETGVGLGMHQALVPALEDLVRRHPLRERLWASLMTALYRSGRQADALAAYRRVRTILREELGIDPSPELARQEERILLHDPGLGPPSDGRPTGNLPVGYTSFVGRGRELSELTRLLGRERLVTLTGPGGSGKTRLALELVASVHSSYPDGVWFVDLATVTDPGHVAPATAAVFELAQEPATPIERILLEFLTGKRLLLVLDNCEHVGPATASLAEAVLGGTRETTVLATSREPLGFTGEVIYRVGPLPTPPSVETDPDRLADVDSVQLFVDRAAAADPGFRLGPELAPVVAEICRRLDGIPLAIELAARQLHVLGPKQLRRGLLDHLELLAAPGEADHRHRTMEAAIEWSYRLLEEDARSMFAALSVFPGSFTVQAAQRVCRGEGISGGSPVPLLTRLVSRSMVLRLGSEEGTRYRLLEPMRAFAAQRAAEAGRTGSLGRAQAEWVLELLSEGARIMGPAERERLRRLSAEQHHLPVALEWAIAHDPELALRLVVAVSEYIGMVVYGLAWAEQVVRAIAAGEGAPVELRAAALAEGALVLAENYANHETASSWAQEALRLSAPGETGTEALAEFALGMAIQNTGALEESERLIRRAIATFDERGDAQWSAQCRRWLGWIEMRLGNYEESIRVCAEAASIWTRMGSEWGTAKALWIMASSFALKGDYDQAQAHAARSLALFERFDDPASPAHVRAVRGDAARLSGRYEKAEAIYLECLRGFQEVGDRRCTASTLKNLGLVALHRDRPEEAGSLLLAALERRHRLGDEAGLSECLEGLGLVAKRRAAYELAVILLGAADRLRAQTASAAPEPERVAIEAAVAGARQALGGEPFTAAWDRGNQLEPDEAVTEAQRVLDPFARAV